MNRLGPEKTPIDIVGECIPADLPADKSAMQQMVDEGLAFWDNDGEFCLSLIPSQITQAINILGT